MSAEKYPSIFSRQMEAIVYLVSSDIQENGSPVKIDQPIKHKGWLE